ncbi:MAG: hypothetical protein WBP41_01590, partial [Saprospiraceae bacterium]
MIKTLLFILFLLETGILYSQQDWELKSRIERNAYTILEGSIDNKYPITMYLELVGGSCGQKENANYRWHPRIM